MPKKTKAIKVSDVKAEKPWLRKAGIESYNIDSLVTKKKFLIICEGQTESLYFESFALANANIKTIHLGCSKTALVECALEMDIEQYDETWCVFDYDIKHDNAALKDDFNGAIRKAINASTEEHVIKCAYSNDSFEIWFVLHYLYLDQKYHRTFYFEKLSKIWGVNYEADGKKRAFALKIYQRLTEDAQANQENAIIHAKKLHEAVTHLPYHLQNPVTTVYQLVEELNTYLKK